MMYHTSGFGNGEVIDDAAPSPFVFESSQSPDSDHIESVEGRIRSAKPLF